MTTNITSSILASMVRKLIFSISVVWLAFLFIYLPIQVIPAEDAVILYRYSENLAQTGVISYNFGGAPVEGATDFLWMLILAGASFIGISVYVSVIVLSFLSLMLLAFILVRHFTSPTVSKVITIAAVLSLLPPTASAIDGFSTLFFGSVWAFLLYTFMRGETRRIIWLGLLLSFIRPEGVALMAPVVVVRLYQDRGNFRHWTPVVGGVMTLGIGYFIWRFHYFGYLLPLPFYIKTSFDKILGLFNMSSLKTNVLFVLPIFVIQCLRLLNKRLKDLFLVSRSTVGRFILFVGTPFIVYSMFSLLQNVAFRFQYPIMIGCVVWMLSICRTIRQFTVILTCYVFMLLPFSYFGFSRTMLNAYEQVYSISKELKDLTPAGKLAVTEAGRLGYYSGWETIDLWGLNTPEYAVRLIQPEDIAAISADLWVLHSSDYSFLHRAHQSVTQRSWSGMLMNIWSSLHSRDLEVWFVPFYNPDQCKSPTIRFFISLRQAFRKELYETIRGHKLPFDDYHLYLINTKSMHREGIRDLLLRYNAIPPLDYFENRQEFEAIR